MKKYNIQLIKELAQNVLCALNTPPALAKRVVAELVFNDLCGYRSHGIIRILQYAKDASAGHLVVTAQPRLKQHTSHCLTIDGEAAFGCLVMDELIDQIRHQAKNQAVTLASVNNAHHLGRLMRLGKELSSDEAGLWLLVFCNYQGGGARVALPNDVHHPRLSTNPLLLSFPVKDKAPFILDMSTTQVSEGSIAWAKATQQKVPIGALQDTEGCSTQNAYQLYEDPPTATMTALGSPLAGHKGYGLAVFIEAFVGLLGGAHSICNPKGNGNGLFAIALNPRFFGDPAAMAHSAQALIQHAYAFTDGAQPTRYPGSLSMQKSKDIHTDTTIELPESIFLKLKSLAKKEHE